MSFSRPTQDELQSVANKLALLLKAEKANESITIIGEILTIYNITDVLGQPQTDLLRAMLENLQAEQKRIGDDNEFLAGFDAAPEDTNFKINATFKNQFLPGLGRELTRIRSDIQNLSLKTPEPTKDPEDVSLSLQIPATKNPAGKISLSLYRAKNGALAIKFSDPVMMAAFLKEMGGKSEFISATGNVIFFNQDVRYDQPTGYKPGPDSFLNISFPNAEIAQKFNELIFAGQQDVSGKSVAIKDRIDSKYGPMNGILADNKNGQVAIPIPEPLNQLAQAAANAAPKNPKPTPPVAPKATSTVNTSNDAPPPSSPPPPVSDVKTAPETKATVASKSSQSGDDEKAGTKELTSAARVLVELSDTAEKMFERFKKIDELFETDPVKSLSLEEKTRLRVLFSTFELLAQENNPFPTLSNDPKISGMILTPNPPPYPPSVVIVDEAKVLQQINDISLSFAQKLNSWSANTGPNGLSIDNIGQLLQLSSLPFFQDRIMQQRSKFDLPTPPASNGWNLTALSFQLNPVQMLSKYTILGADLRRNLGAFKDAASDRLPVNFPDILANAQLLENEGVAFFSQINNYGKTQKTSNVASIYTEKQMLAGKDSQLTGAIIVEQKIKGEILQDIPADINFLKGKLGAEKLKNLEINLDDIYKLILNDDAKEAVKLIQNIQKKLSKDADIPDVLNRLNKLAEKTGQYASAAKAIQINIASYAKQEKKQIKKQNKGKEKEKNTSKETSSTTSALKIDDDSLTTAPKPEIDPPLSSTPFVDPEAPLTKNAAASKPIETPTVAAASPPQTENIKKASPPPIPSKATKPTTLAAKIVQDKNEEFVEPFGGVAPLNNEATDTDIDENEPNLDDLNNLGDLSALNEINEELQTSPATDEATEADDLDPFAALEAGMDAAKNMATEDSPVDDKDIEKIFDDETPSKKPPASNISSVGAAVRPLPPIPTTPASQPLPPIPTSAVDDLDIIGDIKTEPLTFEDDDWDLPSMASPSVTPIPSSTASSSTPADDGITAEEMPSPLSPPPPDDRVAPSTPAAAAPEKSTESVKEDEAPSATSTTSSSTPGPKMPTTPPPAPPSSPRAATASAADIRTALLSRRDSVAPPSTPSAPPPPSDTSPRPTVAPEALDSTLTTGAPSASKDAIPKNDATMAPFMAPPSIDKSTDNDARTIGEKLSSYKHHIDLLDEKKFSAAGINDMHAQANIIKERLESYRDYLEHTDMKESKRDKKLAELQPLENKLATVLEVLDSARKDELSHLVGFHGKRVTEFVDVNGKRADEFIKESVKSPSEMTVSSGDIKEYDATAKFKVRCIEGEYTDKNGKQTNTTTMQKFSEDGKSLTSTLHIDPDTKLSSARHRRFWNAPIPNDKTFKIAEDLIENMRRAMKDPNEIMSIRGNNRELVEAARIICEHKGYKHDGQVSKKKVHEYELRLNDSPDRLTNNKGLALSVKQAEKMEQNTIGDEEPADKVSKHL